MANETKKDIKKETPTPQKPIQNKEQEVKKGKDEGNMQQGTDRPAGNQGSAMGRGGGGGGFRDFRGRGRGGFFNDRGGRGGRGGFRGGFNRGGHRGGDRDQQQPQQQQQQQQQDVKPEAMETKEKGSVEPQQPQQQIQEKGERVDRGDRGGDRGRDGQGGRGNWRGRGGGGGRGGGYKGERREKVIHAPPQFTEDGERMFSGRCRLFCGNLPQDMSQDDFETMFKPYGEFQEAFISVGRGFGFIRMDTIANAKKAKRGLDGQQRRGRNLRIRFASHPAALKVKHLHQYVSNEMLKEAFETFGEIEKAVVIIDDKGRPTGEGIVEFARKPGATMALNRICDGVFLMGSIPRPVSVEPLVENDDDDGLPEMFMARNQDYNKEREAGSRFAQIGSFEYDFAQKWKEMYIMHQEAEDNLKRQFTENVVKLEIEQANAQMEYQTQKLREDLLRRQEELRKMEEQHSREVAMKNEMRTTQDQNRQRIELMRKQEVEERRKQQEQYEQQREQRTREMQEMQHMREMRQLNQMRSMHMREMRRGGSVEDMRGGNNMEGGNMRGGNNMEGGNMRGGNSMEGGNIMVDNMRGNNMRGNSMGENMMGGNIIDDNIGDLDTMGNMGNMGGGMRGGNMGGGNMGVALDDTAPLKPPPAPPAVLGLERGRGGGGDVPSLMVGMSGGGNQRHEGRGDRDRGMGGHDMDRNMGNQGNQGNQRQSRFDQGQGQGNGNGYGNQQGGRMGGDRMMHDRRDRSRGGDDFFEAKRARRF